MGRTFAVIFVTLWLVGISSQSTLHGYLHVLPLVALISSSIPVLAGKVRRLE
jgi:hypothetical protein